MIINSSGVVQKWLWLLIVALISRTAYVFILIFIRRRHPSKRQKRKASPIKTLVVLGSGGHTTEMLELLKNIDPQIHSPFIFIVATTDDTSERRVAAFGGRPPDVFHKIPRSREVGQSYITSVATTLYSFPCAFWLVGKIRPDLLICNGPGTCLPIAIATLVYRILGITQGNLVFVESFCRVTSLSLTGKLLYPLADMFVVHWDELHQRFPWSQTASTFVENKTKLE